MAECVWSEVLVMSYKTPQVFDSDHKCPIRTLVVSYSDTCGVL